jgi:glycosyltransferase involved in cell wall biosynthesis/peptidoglycan/xylan/chitin deacetylase (PgdA/CDA1 family)
MLRNRLYYAVKPLVPRSLRWKVRSWFASQKRQEVCDRWPILPGSERPLEGWPGWPDGKKFAFVLTHDVEGQDGVDKCRQLMALEAKLGFRSSFNFIPEGGYRVSSELRRELAANGFEIGVHDLHHDGKLYCSRASFAAKAVRINNYLKDWGAVGFRSGYMLHNLGWLGALDALYDASTFDTDPFEPQPDGVGTIFPFWVPCSGDGLQSSRFDVQGSKFAPTTPSLHQSTTPLRSGYVELPYTLAQDSTLFLLLRQRHPDIWFQKLDWVARHGGLALVNVHPDYVRFEGESASPLTFPAEFYSRLLEYARQRYGDSFWQPLPRDVAAFTAQVKPSRPHIPRRVCMVAYSDYFSDTRVTRYADALARRQDHVDVLTLRATPESPVHEKFGNLEVFRLQSRFGRTERAKFTFLARMLRFLFLSSIWITRRHARQRYDLLHVHNVPDFLVFAAWYPKLTGAKVILDIHDILPEFYGNKFGRGADSKPSPNTRMLKWLERACARFANHVIIANHLWLDKYAARTRSNGKCSVFINNVEVEVFRPIPRTRHDGKFIILFPGGLQWHQGLDIAIRAFQKVSAEVPEAEFHIYGDGNMQPNLVALARQLGLDGKVRFFNPLSVRQIAEIMANADLGVVPKRADSFGNEAYSTKIMEFMAVGVPVVVSSTKIDRYYFDNSVVRFFESGNADALAEALLELIRHPELRRRLAAAGLAYAARNRWESRSAAYVDLVDTLLARNGKTPKEWRDPLDACSQAARSAFPVNPIPPPISKPLPAELVH